MRRIFVLLLIIPLSISIVHAQQKFRVGVSKIGDGKVKIEWVNPYGDSIVQLNIQRSWDSVKNYLTIFAPLSPELPQNGFIDPTGYAGMYYRAFYVLEDGTFFFTKSVKTTSGSDFTNDVSEDSTRNKNFRVTVHDDDTIIAQYNNYADYKKFRDSIIYNTKDTLYSLTDADVLIRYYDNNIRWVPSTHVFTNTEGYVQISLADVPQKKYSLRFFDEKRKFLFTIKNVTQPQLMLDKTDFMRSGWFYFELSEDGKVKERNKFYLPKDF